MKAGEDFVRLMTEHQGRLFGYLLGLVGDPDRANEVLQETNVVLWRDHAEFRPGSNFKAWAFRVAHFQVMAFRQRRLRDRLVFEDDVVQTLAAESRDIDALWDDRRERLEGCLSRLPAEQRELLRRRYAGGESLQDLATARRSTPNAVTQALFRIRQNLLACVGGGPA